MPRPIAAIWFSVSAAGFVAGAAHAAPVAYLGMVRIDPIAVDASGLNDTLEDGTPHNRLGGIGSAIAYAGRGNRYLLLPDRGPNAGKWNADVDHTTSFHTRFHAFEITVDASPSGARNINAKLISTTQLLNESGGHYVGLSSAYDTANPSLSFRRDPEGIRVGRQGEVFICDEYGPCIDVFNINGSHARSLPVPPAFQIASPASRRNLEYPPHNAAGRLANRGFEGLAISPDGRSIVACTQSPLIQDNQGQPKPVTPYIRLLVVDVNSGASRQLLYLLDHPDHVLSEILAVSDHEFLVLERDGLGGAKATAKKLVLIDIRGATDVSQIDSLSNPGALNGVIAVSKTLFLDLISGTCAKQRRLNAAQTSPVDGFADFRADLTRGVPFDQFPEKLEGVTFGPDLQDGRRLLLISSDNDFLDDQPSFIFAFAIDRQALPSFQPQHIDAPAEPAVAASQTLREEGMSNPPKAHSNIVRFVFRP